LSTNTGEKVRVHMSSVGERLQAIHSGTVDEPLPEWLEQASCGPAVKHLSHLAMHTAMAGGSEADWRLLLPLVEIPQSC
jgi:hypothetical protein